MDTTKWKSIAIEVHMYDSLKERAKKNHRSVSKEVTHILEEVLAQQKEKEVA